MEPILEIELNKERHFPAEPDKFQYLDEKLSFYSGLEPILERATTIDYGLRIASPEGKTLWIGGAHGGIGAAACSSRSGAIPYFSFIQDIVCLRVLLGAADSRTAQAEEFSDRLLDYAIHFYTNGWIAEPAIKVDQSNPPEIRNAVEELRFAQLGWPASFISMLEKQYIKLVLEGKGLKGNYDPPHIMEEFHMKICSSPAGPSEAAL